jgi:tetratricopeptide (TPR) repeat protein
MARRMVSLAVLAIAILLACLFGLPVTACLAAAPVISGWEWCANSGDLYWSKLTIKACTSIIIADKETRHGLAVAYGSRCRAYVNNKQFDRGLQDCNEAIWLDPKLAPAFVSRGFIYARMEKYDRALADYDQAIRFAPNLSSAYDHRAIVYKENRRYGRAVADFAHALWLDASDAKAWSGLCWTTALMDEGDRAIAYCKKSLRLRPNDLETLIGVGFADLRAHAFQDAISDYSSAIRVDALPARSLYGRGIAKLKIGDGSGFADVADAKVVQTNIAEQFATLYGIKSDGRIVPLPPGEPDGSERASFGLLGVTVQPLTADLATAFGIRPGAGVLVARVYDRGPAKMAGIVSGDIILEINGKLIRSLANLLEIIPVSTVVEQFRVAIIRHGRQESRTIAVGFHSACKAAKSIGQTSFSKAKGPASC